MTTPVQSQILKALADPGAYIEISEFGLQHRLVHADGKRGRLVQQRAIEALGDRLQFSQVAVGDDGPNGNPVSRYRAVTVAVLNPKSSKKAEA